MFNNENEIFCQFWKDKNTFRVVYFGFKSNLEYNIQVLTIEMTGRKP